MIKEINCSINKLKADQQHCKLKFMQWGWPHHIRWWSICPRFDYAALFLRLFII